MPQQPAIGADVSSLMPQIGDDVSHLMGAPASRTASAKPDVLPALGGMIAPFGGEEIGRLVNRVPGARRVANAIPDLLPAIGGTVGGIVGGVGGFVGGVGVGGVPGAVGGAALGGGAGEASKQLMNRAIGRGAPSSSGEAATDIGVQGAVQGATELVGQGLAKVASKAAPWLMNRALNLTDVLAREFPNLSATMIEHALTVTQGGMTKARAILRAAKTVANKALETAHAAGARVPITAATDGLMQTVTKVINSADIDGGLRALAGAERRIVAGRAAAMTPMEADALKTSLQTQSKALYRAEKMGQGRPNATVHAEALKDMAESLNTALSDITTKAGATGYRIANAQAQEMIGAVRGIAKGTRTGSNLYQAMVRPGVGATMGALAGAHENGTSGAVLGAMGGGALMSPAGMSHLAIVLAKPGLQAVLRQSPRVAAALMQLMGAGPDEPQP